MDKSRTQPLRALAALLLAIAVARTQSAAAGAWLKFGTIDLIVAAAAVFAFVGTLTRAPRFTGIGVAAGRYGRALAVGALALNAARLLLSALDVGVPQNGSRAGSSWDTIAVVTMVVLLAVTMALTPGGLQRPLRVPRLRLPPARVTLPLGTLGAAGAFVAFFRLGTPSWLIDELFYRAAGHEYVSHGTYLINREHVFLAKDAIGFFQLIFGTGVTATRLPSALAGFATGVGLFAIGRRLSGLLAGAAAFAAWTLLPHPIHSDFGNTALISIDRYALLDPMMVLFLVVALGCGWRWIQTHSTRWAIAFGIAGGLAAASKLTALTVVPALLLYAVIIAPDRLAAIKQAIGGAAATGAVILISYLPPLGDSPSTIGGMLHLQRVHNALGHPVLIDGHVYRRAPVWAHLFWQWQAAGPVVTGALLITALVAPLYIGWRLGAYLWVAVLAPLLYLSLFVGFGLPHYYFIWQAPLTLLAALGFASIVRASGTVALAAATALAAPVAVVMAITIADAATLRPNDYAAAGVLLARHGLAGADVAVWYAPGLEQEYLPRAHITMGPSSGGRPLQAIVVDPNFAATISNRPLQAYLYLSRRNFLACRVNRLTVYLRTQTAETC